MCKGKETFYVDMTPTTTQSLVAWHFAVTTVMWFWYI